ncbi:mammalian cell entry protein [Mycobacterium sp. SMC-4]|uniref:mammalian cell entry protein n=1 Tax=Mycobacterium sp. SMC-4 TaxID=2857059 RepID=UPI003D046985
MGEHDDPSGGTLTQTTGAQRVPPWRSAVAVCLVALAALGGLGGWMGYRLIEERQDAAEQSQFLEAARQGAVNLTTIGHATVDADVKRIIDSSTGVFREDFEKRAVPFAEVVKQAQSVSEGSVTSAALETREGDTARVLVVMSVKMSSAGAPQQEPQIWRMRVGVQRSDGATRVSDVEFV